MTLLVFPYLLIIGSNNASSDIQRRNKMSNKLFSKATFAAIAVAVVASTASMGSAQAGGYGHGWGHGHGHGWGHKHHRSCFYKYKRVWSSYYGYYIKKRIKVCY